MKLVCYGRSEFEFASVRSYLASDVWATQRMLLHAHDGPFACFVCGATEPIELHHRSYDNIGRERIVVDIVPLCVAHHHEVERLIRTNGVARYDAHLHYVASLAHRRGDLRHLRPRAVTTACGECSHGTVVGPNGERWRCNACGGLGRTTPADISDPAQDRKEPAWS